MWDRLRRWNNEDPRTRKFALFYGILMGITSSVGYGLAPLVLRWSIDISPMMHAVSSLLFGLVCGIGTFLTWGRWRYGGRGS